MPDKTKRLRKVMKIKSNKMRNYKVTSRRLNKKRKFNRSSKKGGGINITNIGRDILSDVEINPGKINRTFSTNVTVNGNKNPLIYIIPQTILLKNVQSMRVPTFMININETPTPCSIRIENKYINYLVKLDTDWYGVMRLSLWTLNAGVFATWTNTVFYKLKGVITLDNKTNVIKVNENSYDIKIESSWGIFRKADAPILQLKSDNYSPITKKDGNVFDILTRFRNIQLASYSAKQEVVDQVIDSGTDNIF
jgi:hypothetical protein